MNAVKVAEQIAKAITEKAEDGYGRSVSAKVWDKEGCNVRIYVKGKKGDRGYFEIVGETIVNNLSKERMWFQNFLAEEFGLNFSEEHEAHLGYLIEE